jgi:hypothetical protein
MLKIAIRTVLWWVNFVVWGTIYGGIILFALYAWNRGPEAVVNDISAIWGDFMGTWEFYKEQEQAALRYRQQQQRMAYQQRGRGYRPR